MNTERLRYQTAEGAEIRIIRTEMPAPRETYREGGTTRGRGEEATRGWAEKPIQKAKLGFEEALGMVKSTATAFHAALKDASPDEITVEFSLKSEGEAGLFSICSANIGAEFKVTLTWQNKS